MAVGLWGTRNTSELFFKPGQSGALKKWSVLVSGSENREQIAKKQFWSVCGYEQKEQLRKKLTPLFKK